MTTIKEIWEAFTKSCIRNSATPQELEELRIAFYCGTGAFYHIFAEAYEKYMEDPENNPHPLVAVDAVRKECDAFQATFRKGAR